MISRNHGREPTCSTSSDEGLMFVVIRKQLIAAAHGEVYDAIQEQALPADLQTFDPSQFCSASPAVA